MDINNNVTEKDLYQSIPVCFQKGFLNNDISNLMFYMYFLQLTHVDFEGKKNKVPTAGAGLIGNHYKITINPDFWLDKVNLKIIEQRLILLIHECIHIVEQDCYHTSDYSDHYLHNVAIDLKANSVIIDANCGKYLPGVGDTQEFKTIYEPMLKKLMDDYMNELITKEKYTEELSKIPVRGIHPDDYDDPEINVKNCINNGTKWIYDKLKKDQEKQNQTFKVKIKISKSEQDESDNQSGSGNSDNSDVDPTNEQNDSKDTTKDENPVPLGSNSYVNAKIIIGEDPTSNSFTDFEEISESQKDFCENQLEHIVGQVLDSLESTGKSVGNIPAGLKRLIDKIKNPPKPVYDWKKHLRKYISMHGRRTNVSRTFNKPNMFLEENPRLKFIPDMYLLCALDTSRSMSQKDIIEVVSELYNIRSVLSASMDLCTMDVSIYNIEEIKDKNSINKFVEKNGLRGNGGTYMEPFIEELNRNPKYSYGIYLTDGYVSESKIKPIKPYMVLLTSGGADIKWKGVPVVKIPADYFNKTK